jgi:predicted O-methyltransferase YrrM
VERLFLVFRYLLFLFRSGNEHSIHSPYIFDLYLHSIKPKKHFYIFSEIEKIRTEFLQSKKKICVKDYGAGSRVNASAERTISSIARHSEKSPELAQLLFRLIDYTKPLILFDLGTSLGTTTIYVASANKKSIVYTFEGCPGTAAIAEQNFKRLRLSNIKMILGNIDSTLSDTLATVPQVDFVFFDANHRYEPTIRYFEQCLQKSHENSLFVFDDIHWSDEMEKAWEEIKQHPEVTITVDLFFLGLVFFRKKQPKQHFILRQ